jgi:hypothetical protein
LVRKRIENISWYMKRQKARRIYTWCQIWAQNRVRRRIVCYSGSVSWCRRHIGNLRIFARRNYCGDGKWKLTHRYI